MKKRHINKLEFLGALQIEYLQAKFRHSINHSPKQKKFFAFVMNCKRDKIEDLAKDLGVSSIFEEQSEMKRLSTATFPDEMRNEFKFFLSEEEKKLYYSKGAPVSVKTESGRKLGKLIEAKFEIQVALIKIRGEKEPKNLPFSMFFRLI